MTKKFIFAICILAIVFSLACLVYLLFWPKQQTSNNTQNIAIDTSDWKTYRNDELGFEFKYPSDFDIYFNEDIDQRGYYQNKQNLILAIQIKDIKKDETVWCTSGAYEPKRSGGSYIFSLYKSNNDSYDSIKEDCGKSTEAGYCKSEMINVNNKSILLITSRMELCGEYPSAYYVNSNFKYSIDSVWYNKDKTPSKNYQELFYKILNTLKFFNGWKTYRNDELGFEFRYPETWYVKALEGERTVFVDSSPINNDPVQALAAISVSLINKKEYVDIANPKEIKEITVGGFRGTEKTYFSDMLNEDAFQIIIPKNDKIYVINSKKNDDMFAKFIGSFTFLGAKPSNFLAGYVFIKNSSDNNVPGVAYNSLPDTLKLLSLSGEIISINTDIYPEQREDYKWVGDRVYFLNKRDHLVEYIDYQGRVHTLDFTKVASDNYFGSYVLSPDGKKISWVESKANFSDDVTGLLDDRIIVNSQIYVANIDGTNKRVVLEKNFPLGKELFIKLIRWSKFKDEIFFTEQRAGLGGYILFLGPTNLSKINLETGKVKNIMPLETDQTSFFTDISNDEKYLAVFKQRHIQQQCNPPRLYIENLVTGETSEIKIDTNNCWYRYAGSGYFSPDGKYLVYSMARSDPSNEKFKTMLVDLRNNKQEVIIDKDATIFRPEAWLSNNEIVIINNYRDYYLFDIKTKQLKTVNF